MAAPGYLISKIADPIFAISIGTTATWLRIRREECERALETSSASGLSSATTSDPIPSDTPTSHPLDPAAQKQAVLPSSRDTLDVLWRRVKSREWDVRKWDWKDMTRPRESWGIVEPTEVGAGKHE